MPTAARCAAWRCASGAFARKGRPAEFGTFRMTIRADGTIARTPAISVA
jgi:hypothetical protein